MALQLSYDDPHGSTHAAAYHRVIACTLNVETEEAKVVVATYVNASARNNAKVPVKKRSYVVNGSDYTDHFGTTALDVASVNFISSAYDHLKTLGDFSGAADV